jgi:2,3-bisphosphoglycerate-dependent phosphoglycerate mutase
MLTARAARPHPRGRARGGQGRSHPLPSLLLLLLALLAAPAAALDTVYLVRHAEKAEGWPADRDLDAFWPLSQPGVARAQTLATRLKDAGIAAVYSSRTTRSLHTGLPLARSANIPLIADEATIKPDRMAAFLSTLRAKHAQDRAVLIVGHSNTIPELLIQLGAKPDCFAKLGITGETGKLLTEGYEGLWRVDVKGEGCGAIVRE